MHLGLMRNGHASAHIYGILPALYLNLIFKQFMAVLERLQAMEYRTILHVALIPDVKVLSFIPTDGRAWGDEDPLSQCHRADNRGKGMNPRRPVDDRLRYSRIK